MLRAFTLDLKGNWDDYLPLVEFSIIITFKLALGWNLLRGYIVGNVDILFVKMML